MDRLTCTICGSDMKPGRAALRKNIPAKLSWPFPSDRLFFKPDGGEQKSETVIREGQVYQAFKCDQCNAVLLTNRR